MPSVVVDLDDPADVRTFVRDHVGRAASPDHPPTRRHPCGSPCSTRSPCPGRGDPTASTHAYQNTHRAGGRRRPVGLGRVLDRRAPLPRGVLALLEPRGALRRHRRPHRAHPPRLRRPAHAPAVQPPRAHAPSRSRCSTSSRTGGSTSAPVGRRPAPSSRASASTRARPAQMWQEAIEHMVGLLDQRRARASTASTGRCRRGGCCPSPVQAAAPAAVGRDHQRGRPPPGRLAGSRPVLVRGRRPARGGEAEDRHLPRGARRVHRADRRLRERRARPRSR